MLTTSGVVEEVLVISFYESVIVADISGSILNHLNCSFKPFLISNAYALVSL